MDPDARLARGACGTATHTAFSYQPAARRPEGFDDTRLDRHIVGDQLGEVFDVEGKRPPDVLFQIGKSIRVADDLVLDALGQAAPQLARGQRLTEILKQDQFVPLPAEKQVLIIQIGTSGALDTLPVPEVRRFEREFLQFTETNYPSLLKNVAAKKALDDGIKAEIKKAVDAFKERFTVEAAGAAN